MRSPTIRRIVSERALVPTRDGIRLATDVLYADDGLRRPAIVIRTPYPIAAARQTYDVVGLVAAGWCVVIQDTRGRGGSEGTALLFTHEAEDGADTLDWCVAQPWCNGRVVGLGASYQGFTQWKMAATGHRALRAIAPVQAAAGVQEGWFFEGGVFTAACLAHYGAHMVATDPSVGSDVREAVARLQADPATLAALPPSLHPLREMSPSYRVWTASDSEDYWRHLDIAPARTPMDVAGYHVVGWYDLFAEAGIALWKELREHAASEYARASQRLIIGYWPHGIYGQSTPEMDFGAEASIVGSGTWDRMVEWLRDAVDTKPVEDGVHAFVMGVNRWWDLPDWPPQYRDVELYLGAGPRGARSARGDGTLQTAPNDVGRETFVHDPTNPVPTRGGRLLGLARPLPGMADHRDIEMRDDVLVYSTAPLRADLTIAGSVQAMVYFESDAPTADVAAKLIDVLPDGRALNVVDSIRRCTFTPGVPAEVAVQLGSVAHAFRAGHRIRVEISSSNAPRFEVNRSVLAGRDEAVTPRKAIQTVHHGGRSPSRLILPVVQNLDGTDNARAL